MIPRMRPSYSPVLYKPDGYARFRQYPRQVETPIPGAGYDVEGFAWAEQELNLGGGSSPSQYGYGGEYGVVPLRGLGAEPKVLSPEQSKAMYTLTPQEVASMNDEPSGDEEGGPVLDPGAQPPQKEQWISTPLLWGLGLGVFALGGAVWWMRRRS